MKITYVKSVSEGVEEESVVLTIKGDLRWPSIDTEIHLSLKDANELLSKLSKELSAIPF